MINEEFKNEFLESLTKEERAAIIAVGKIAEERSIKLDFDSGWAHGSTVTVVGKHGSTGELYINELETNEK